MPGDRKDPRFKQFEKYLKKVWFANGIHHHYSTDKFRPEFTEAYFDELVAGTPKTDFPMDFGSVERVIAEIKPVVFDPEVMPKRVNLAPEKILSGRRPTIITKGSPSKRSRSFMPPGWTRTTGRRFLTD